MGKNLSEGAEASGSIEKQSTDECWLLKNLEDTFALGAVITKKLPNLKLLLIQGSIGAGKTSLVKGIARSLGIIEPVTSPTFSLAQHYPNGKPPLIHLDLYRLDNPITADELFLQEEEEAIAMGALMVIEWPERLSLSLPEACQLHLQIHPHSGRIAKINYPSIESKNFST